MIQQARLLILPLRKRSPPLPNPSALRTRRVQPVSNRTSWESGWSLDSGFCPTPFLCPRGQVGAQLVLNENPGLQGSYLVANYSVLTTGRVLWLRVRLSLFPHQATDLSSAVPSVTTESSVKFGYKLRPRVS